MRPLLLVLVAGAVCAADAIRPLPIVNGAMSDGSDTCTAWSGRWTASGKLTASRDTKVFKKGPASLCLATDGDAKGNVHQRIDVPGGVVLDLAGWVRTEGPVKVLVFVQVFDSDWKPIDYQVLKNLVEPTDWTAFAGKATLAPAAAHVAIGMQVDGNGKAWLDEVRNAGEPEKK